MQISYRVRSRPQCTLCLAGEITNRSKSYTAEVIRLLVKKLVTNHCRTPLMMAADTRKDDRALGFATTEVTALLYDLEESKWQPDALNVMETVRLLVENGASDSTESVEEADYKVSALGLYAFPFEEPLRYMINQIDETQIEELLESVRQWKYHRHDYMFDSGSLAYAHIANFKVLSHDLAILNKVFIEALSLVWFFREPDMGLEHPQLIRLRDTVKSLIKLGANIHTPDDLGYGTVLTRVICSHYSDQSYLRNTSKNGFEIFIVRWWFDSLYYAGVDLLDYAVTELRQCRTRPCPTRRFWPIRRKRMTTDLHEVDTFMIAEGEETGLFVSIYQSKTDREEFFWALRIGDHEVPADSDGYSEKDGEEEVRGNLSPRDSRQRNSIVPLRSYVAASSTIMPGSWID